MPVFASVDLTQPRARRKGLRCGASHGTFDVDHRVFGAWDPLCLYFKLSETQMKGRLFLTVDGLCAATSLEGFLPIYIDCCGADVVRPHALAGAANVRQSVIIEIPMSTLEGPAGWENNLRVTTAPGANEFWIYGATLSVESP